MSYLERLGIILLVILVYSILVFFVVKTVGAETVPSQRERQQIVHDAIKYWRDTDGNAAARALRNAEVIWSVDGVCATSAGCAYVGGCTTLPADYCKVWVYGAGINYWGQDWLLSVMKHEMGHLLGYSHGDPTCTMNEEYC